MFKELILSSSGRMSLALFIGGVAAVTFSQASLTRVESNLIDLHEFHSPALSSIEDIRAKLGEAVQEGFAYVVSGSPEEKAEFMAWNSNFPLARREFETIARLHEADEAEERLLFQAIVELQAEMVTRANAMFEEYEATGSVSSETFQHYELVIDQTLTALDEFVAIERDEVSMLYRDSLD